MAKWELFGKIKISHRIFYQKPSDFFLWPWKFMLLPENHSEQSHSLRVLFQTRKTVISQSFAVYCLAISYTRSFDFLTVTLCLNQFDPVRCFSGSIFGVSPPHGRRRFCLDYGAVLKNGDQSDFHDLMAVLESRIWRKPFFEEQDTQRHKKSRNSHKRQMRLQFMVFIENTYMVRRIE